MEWGTIANIILAFLTGLLLIMNYIVLRESIKQNAKSIEITEENLKINQISLDVNKSLLDQNKKMIERQELNNRPKFEMQNYNFDMITGEPLISLINTGGISARIKSVEVMIIIDRKYVVKELEISKIVKPGAPLSLEMGFPVTIMDFEFQRKDQAQITEGEINFFSISIIIQYIHADDVDPNSDFFKDILKIEDGKNPYISNNYYSMPNARLSNEQDTWYSILGKGLKYQQS